MTDAAERRALILQAADRLLRHYGPHKTTVADVAREAGVGVGTVYLEFQSKDAIVEELSRSRHRIVLASMRAAANAVGRTYPERLSDVFDARLEAYTAIVEEGTHACDLVHCASAAGKAAPLGAAAIPGVKQALQSFWEQELALVTDVIQRGVALGELVARDPEATARALLKAYAAFAPPWIAGRDRAGDPAGDRGDARSGALRCGDARGAAAESAADAAAAEGAGEERSGEGGTREEDGAPALSRPGRPRSPERGTLTEL
ncbi:MAG: helix-turn-helix domain-containing protein [Minicystis sp.]